MKIAIRRTIHYRGYRIIEDTTANYRFRACVPEGYRGCDSIDKAKEIIDRAVALEFNKAYYAEDKR